MPPTETAIHSNASQESRRKNSDRRSSLNRRANEQRDRRSVAVMHTERRSHYSGNNTGHQLFHCYEPNKERDGLARDPAFLIDTKLDQV